MDKKRKTDSPTPTPERGGEHERKKMRAKAEEASSIEPEGQDKALQDLTGKEHDSSEANVKVKMGLGAKRTKKPPKSLENFICRPTIRVSQRPAPAVGDGARAKSKSSNQLHQPVQKKCNGNSRASKTSSSTSTDQNQSTQSLSALTTSKKGSPASDSPNTTAAKKIVPKQTRQKTDLQQELTLEEPPNEAQPQSSSQLSIGHRITPTTPTKQTSSHMPAASSPTPMQQDSSPQEGIRFLNENVMEHGQALPDSSRGSPNGTKGRSSYKKHSVPPEQTSSFPKKDSKHTENDSETFWSVNVNRKESKGCGEDSGSDNSDSRPVTGERNPHQNDSMQKPSPCANDQAQNVPSVQIAGFSSLNKLPDNTSDTSESSRGSKGQNENEDLNRTLEMTVKSSKAIPVLEQQNVVSTEGSPDSEHGKRNKRCPNQEQMKSHCSSDINSSVDSILKPQALSIPAKPSINVSPSHIKKDKKSSKKQKSRHLHYNKTAKMSDDNHGPVACTTELQRSSENDTPKALSSLQGEQKTVEQPPSSEQSENTTHSEIQSPKIPQARKRGRPKAKKLEVPLQGNNLQPLFSNSLNIQGLDPVLVQQPRSTPVRKRGRPRRSFSIEVQSTQLAKISKRQDAGDQHVTFEDKVKESQQKCNRSSRVIMKTIIRKINKMKVKRRDQVLTQILLGQKQRNGTEFPQEGSGVEMCSPPPPATHSLSSLVTSFGGKLGPQINVSKRGTIYMGKRRGRKPKCERNPTQIPSPNSQQMSADTAQFNSSIMHQSLDSQTSPSSLKKNASASPGRSSQMSINTQKVKATSFMQLSELQNSKVRSETTFTSNIGVGVNDNSMLDRADRETNGKLAASTGFASTLATGSVFTMSGLQGNNSVKGKAKAFSSFPSDHLSSAHLPLGSGRTQDSNGTHIANPLLSFANQEPHKFKCHRRGHHCLSRDKFRRHKYKCKKKYMQLRAKRQDPEFLAEVEDLVVRLREIHIVHHMTRTRLEDDGTSVGRKSVKCKSQSHDLKCLQEDVHTPAMFQINFSGYYSPHSALSCDPLHYVRMANMRRKHSCSSEPNEQIVTHFPVMHKVGYPVSSGGYFHPSYKVPFTTTSLGFGLYRGYPSTAPLYPSSFPSSYVHHYSKNPIISPSKFHKKKTKVPKQDSGGLWGGKSPGTYPRMTSNFSCDCFNRQCWQREKQREKSREGRDEHGRMREREQDIEWLLWQNKLSKDNENSRGHPSSFSVFSNTQNKDRTFPNLGEVRWSEHQPPWQCMRGFDSKLGNRNLNKEFNPRDHEDTVEGEVELTTSQQSSSRRAHSFLKQPKLLTNTQSRRIRKGSGVTSASAGLMEQDGTLVQDFSSLGDKRAGYVQAGSLHFPGKHLCSNSPSAREPENIHRDPKGHKARRRPVIQDECDQACDRTTAPFMREQFKLHSKQPRNAASTRAQPAQNFRSFNNPRGLEITAGNEVKKRGPGRPRKNPPPSPYKTGSSPPSLPSAPRSPPSLPEEKKNSEKGEISNRQDDTVLEVIEAVIHGEQRKRGRKRKNAEGEKDEGQKRGNEEEEVTETPSDLLSSSTPIAPSPEQSVAEDADEDADSQSEQISASLPKKKYLWAGLYSDVYKSEEVQEPEEPMEPSSDCLDYNPEEHEHGLLPAPAHVGKYLRLKRIDFQLPYDVHWLCVRKKLFEMPDSPSSKASGSSCRVPGERTPQRCDDDFPDSRSIDSDDQTDVLELLQEEIQPSHQLLQHQEGSHDDENFPSPLSSEERTFVIKHGVFLVRNYEKMRARQALLLLREEVREQEKEEKGSGQSEDGGDGEETSVQPGPGVCLSEQRSEECPEKEEQHGPQSRDLSDTLQKIWDSIVSCKGSSGQTLTAPLLNLCSRKRSDSALLDLSMVQKQLRSGHYDSLEAFHTDMLRVFHCAEKYYGCESSVGRDVSQLRVLYHKAHQEASAQVSDVL
ncbi:histone-lysine N-methyltransferase ASH1L isoform X1 [Pygocentrus nattereri]|uniref:histone-lysine N-methyltransferase ASH1L isoform X1 n=1 Tax=Pygocentrus nattereri TaxID=42514 RepID=UPI0008145074|nr:histone-lysine N-methyltransferase ASH1L isoform X1 [Pygocentrus nattereri]XP_017570060.1 histone-lysine N-methyltransferase ASH1L isoform X1 [Pygocentrus nattereri]